MKSKKSLTALVQLLEPQAIAYTDTVSSILDTQNFGTAEILVNIGTLASVASGEKVLPILQESASTTGTAFTAVAAADIDGAFTVVDSTAKDSVIQRVAYLGSKRYIRVSLDYTGSAVTGPIAVTGVLGRPSCAPATAPAPITAA